MSHFTDPGSTSGATPNLTDCNSDTESQSSSSFSYHSQSCQSPSSTSIQCSTKITHALLCSPSDNHYNKKRSSHKSKTVKRTQRKKLTLTPRTNPKKVSRTKNKRINVKNQEISNKKRNRVSRSFSESAKQNRVFSKSKTQIPASSFNVLVLPASRQKRKLSSDKHPPEEAYSLEGRESFMKPTEVAACATSSPSSSPISNSIMKGEVHLQSETGLQKEESIDSSIVRSALLSTPTRKSSRVRTTTKPYSPPITGLNKEMERAIKASLKSFEEESCRRENLAIQKYSVPPMRRKNVRSRMNPSFSYGEFIKMWKLCEDDLGLTTEEIENGSLVRNANHSNTTSASSSCLNTAKKKNTYSSSQSNAQYGRILFPAMKQIIEITKLSRNDIFLDIGHGIGNASLQCALTIGCESRGIEIVPERCRVAEQFRDLLMENVEVVAQEERGRRRTIGRVDLREGCLKDPNNRKFITEADVVLVNNAHDIFGTRSENRDDGTATLDTHVGSLFACMKPGARMVTLHPLICLGRNITEENQVRRKRGLEESIDASFFSSEVHSIRNQAVTWSCKDIVVYVYKRTQQSNPNGCAMFLCGNRNCSWQSATMAVDENGILQDTCIYCEFKRGLRTRQKGETIRNANKIN